MLWTKKELTYISSGFQCPSVTNDHIGEYFEDEIHPSALAMYREGWIVSALAAAEEGKVFIQMLIRAEMRKQMRYHVHVVLDDEGAVVQANCECTAGGGSRARCKHVATCMYGLESLARTKNMRLEATCTQAAQIWHAPRKGVATAPPTKAVNIDYKTHKIGEEEEKNKLSAPRQQQPERPGEKDRLLNLLKNYQVRRKHIISNFKCHTFFW